MHGPCNARVNRQYRTFRLFYLAPILFGSNSLIRTEVAVLSVVVLPVSLASALLQRQFFGITRMISRGLVTLVVWVGLLGVYSTGLYLLQVSIDERTGELPRFSTILIGIAIVATTFWPVQ